MKNNNNIWVQITSDDIQKTISSEAIISDDSIEFMDDEKQVHIISIMDQDIRYQKQGNPQMDFYFSDELTEGTYQIDQQTIVFQIKTTELNIKDDTINIRYQLLQENEILSNHSIMIQRNHSLEAQIGKK
jgi:hypothetical protein